MDVRLSTLGSSDDADEDCSACGIIGGSGTEHSSGRDRISILGELSDVERLMSGFIEG